MVYKEANIVYALNAYVWELIKDNLNISEADYEGARPIIPASQQPEFLAMGKPFIVYGSATQPVGHLYAMKVEVVSYVIYARTVGEANNIAGLLADAFQLQDEFAEHINDWLDTQPNRGVTFGSVRLRMTDRAEPSDDEGGFVSSLVIAEATGTSTPLPANAITFP